MASGLPSTEQGGSAPAVTLRDVQYMYSAVELKRKPWFSQLLYGILHAHLCTPLLGGTLVYMKSHG